MAGLVIMPPGLGAFITRMEDVSGALVYNENWRRLRREVLSSGLGDPSRSLFSADINQWISFRVSILHLPGLLGMSERMFAVRHRKDFIVNQCLLERQLPGCVRVGKHSSTGLHTLYHFISCSEEHQWLPETAEVMHAGDNTARSNTSLPNAIVNPPAMHLLFQL